MNIEALFNNADIIAIIDAYILKADKTLEEEFKENDIVEPAEAVKFVNNFADAVTEIEDSYINEVIGTITNKNNYDLKQGFSVKDILEQKIYDIYLRYIGENSLETQFADIFHDMFTEYFNNVLIKNSERIDSEIKITDYSKKSKEWLSDWSHQLAEILNTNDKEAVIKILDSCKDNSKSIKDTADLIAELGVRKEGGSARNLAKTETYRINNYAEQEAMLQNPSVVGKMWDHKGPVKNARKYHLALDGVTIPVDKPFKLNGIKGGTYYPMAPHDTCLPVEEVANCGCRVRPQTSKDIVSKPPKEKAKQQQERLRQADDSWEREFNEKNKKATGINFEKVKLDWVKNKTPEEQIKYFGGNHSGKARKALLDAGVIVNDEQLNKLYKRSSNGKRVLKTLKELEDDGIMTVRKKDFEHVVIGEMKSPNEHYLNGRLLKGGHSKSSFDKCKKLNLGNTIEGKYSNGVTFGSIPTSTTKIKKNGGHTWFPDDWDDDKILSVWTKVKNGKAKFIADKISDRGDFVGKVYNYESVAIVYRQDIKGDSFYPVKEQNEFIKGVELYDK